MKRKNWYLTIGVILTALMLLYIAVGFFWTPYVPSAMSAVKTVPMVRYQLPGFFGMELFCCRAKTIKFRPLW